MKQYSFATRDMVAQMFDRPRPVGATLPSPGYHDPTEYLLLDTLRSEDVWIAAIRSARSVSQTVQLRERLQVLRELFTRLENQAARRGDEALR